MKLYRKNDGRKLVVGDVVKFVGRPHYIYSMREGWVVLISMCERKYIRFCLPIQIDCTEERMEPIVDYKF
jgi:hypothetical protein